MSRKVKNIIMITSIIIVCIASGFIIKLAKESGEGTNQGNPPQMLNSSGENNSNGQMVTQPSKPDESNENNSIGSQQNQMMGKTDGQNDSNSQENENMPSMPDMQNGENNTEIETHIIYIWNRSICSKYFSNILNHVWI